MTQCNVKFCNYNYAVAGATIDFSSEDTLLLAANASNIKRSKVWSPTGLFTITATNNKIYVNLSGDKTGTITAGEYTSSGLATEIQTQLNTASSGWTCSYSTTTYKFTITNSATATLKLTTTTNDIWDEIGFTGTADDTDTTFVADEVRIHTFEFYQVDNGTALAANAVCAICAIDEVFGLSDLAELRFQGNNVDVWDSPPLDVALPFNERGIIKFYDQDVTDTEYRYHRIKIIDRENVVGPSALKIGYIYIGDTEDITSSDVARGMSRAQKDPSILMESTSGQKYADTKAKYYTFNSMNIQNISSTDRDKIEQVFNDYGLYTPLFFSVDPFLELETDPSVYTRYMYFAQPPALNHLFLTYYAVGLAMEEAR